MVRKPVTSDKWQVASRIRRVAFFLSLVTFHSSPLSAQQPQAQAGQQIFPVNAKYVQGFGPGYWPTAGSNLTLILAPGTAVCSYVVRTYAGGALTLAPSTTNYVYLDPANNCAPASSTTGFTTASIPIATVVTTSTAISSIADVRTMFVSSGATRSVTSVGMAGDGIIFSSTVSGSPVTSSGTLAPQLLTQTANTVLAGPGSGPAATPTFRALAPADLPASISSNTTGNAATATALATSPTQCSGNNWATGVSSNGNANCLQPGFGNLSGSAAISQGGTGQTTAAAAFNALSPLSTEGDLLYYHGSANARLAAGGNGQCLISNGADPLWGSCSGSSSLAWSSLLNPAANLTLSMSTFATTFNHTSPVNWTWANTTAATSATSQSSPLLNLSGTYWNGSASAPDSWSFQAVVAGGTNGNSTLTLAHTGSTGTATLSVPNLTATGTTHYGVLYGGGSSSPVGSTAAGASGLPLLGQGSAAPAFATLGIAGGGTGQTAANAGFNALSPLSAEGDLLYFHSSANARLPRGSSGQCLTSNGTDPVWGSCSGSGANTGLGNGTTVIDASLQPGTDFGSKVNAAIGLCPSTGCVVDVRGLGGAQTLATNVNTSIPVVIYLADGLTLTQTGGAQFILGSKVSLEGAGANSTYIVASSSSPMVTAGNVTNVDIGGITFQNTSTGACLSFGSAAFLHVHDNMFQCATDLVFTGYYNRIERNYFSGSTGGTQWAGLLMDGGTGGNTVNSNYVANNKFQGTGTGVFIRGGQEADFEGMNDFEIDALGYFVDTANVSLHEGYFEDLQCTASWAASTLYGRGAVIEDSNGNCEIAMADGTSGSSAPTWPTGLSGSVADGSTLAWMMYYNSQVASKSTYMGILLGPLGMDDIIDGNIAPLSIIDIPALVNGTYTNQIDTRANYTAGQAGQYPYRPGAALSLEFGGVPNPYNNGGSDFRLGIDTAKGIGLALANSIQYGLSLDSNYLCSGTGTYCGHAPLHTGTLHPAAGIEDIGPFGVYQIPNPSAPTVTVPGTPGSSTVSYALVAHCPGPSHGVDGGAVTLVGTFAQITNAPSSPSPSNPVDIQVPNFAYTDWSYYNFNYPPAWNEPYSGCTWDVIKDPTGGTSAAQSIMTAAGAPAGMLQDTGQSLASYAAPTRNTTGDAVFKGVLTTANNTMDDGSGNMSAANKMTAQQFCVGSNCVTSLWSNPMTTLGDLVYGAASGVAARLGGNTSSTNNFLISTGASGAATAPQWGTIATSDLPGSGTTTISGVNCTIGSSCTMTSLNGVSFPASPSNNTVPVVTSSNTITYEAVPPAALPSTLVYTGQVNTYSSGDKQTFGASTSSAASINIPAGTAPTSPAAGDQWFDGDRVYVKDAETNSGVVSSVPRRLGVTSALTAGSTTPVAVGTFAVAANKTYCLMCELFVQSSSTSNKPTMLVTCPSSPTASQFGFVYQPTATTVAEAAGSCGTTLVSPTATGTVGTTLGGNSLTGMLQTGSTAGSLAVQVESSGSYNTIIEPGSYCILY